MLNITGQLFEEIIVGYRTMVHHSRLSLNPWSPLFINSLHKTLKILFLFCRLQNRYLGNYFHYITFTYIIEHLYIIQKKGHPIYFRYCIRHWTNNKASSKSICLLLCNWQNCSLHKTRKAYTFAFTPVFNDAH